MLALSVRLVILKHWEELRFISGLKRIIPVADERKTQRNTGHLTSLYSIGLALLIFAIDRLRIEEMRRWDKRRSRVA